MIPRALTLAIVACWATSVYGQTVRDVYLDAGIPMIRSTRTMTVDWRTNLIAANEQRGYVLYGLTPSATQLYTSAYSPALDPFLEDSPIPHNFTDRTYMAIGAHDGGAVICWQRLSGDMACVSIDEGGAVVGGPVDIARPPWSNGTPMITASASGASIGFTGGTTSGCSNCNVFLRNASLDLTHISPSVTIAAAQTTSDLYYVRKVFRTADDRVGLLYLKSRQSQSFTCLRWIAVDGTLEPEIVLPFHMIAALQDDGDLLAVAVQPSGAWVVQRVSTNGDPLGPAHPLNLSSAYALDISPDGWILAADEDYLTGQLRFRLFNAEGVPAGPWFDPTYFDPELPRNSFDGSFAPVAVTRGGAVWIAWISLPDEPEPAQWHLTSLVPFTRGDLNGDGVFNNFDIDPFVLALTDRPAYEALYPGIAADLVADYDGNGMLNNFDIDLFVAAIVAGP
ncbi:MAG: hypothetical protein IPM64_04700 [Phycisphaerales bacterium]|nr:hypothetical protein [Phycisphaerales bacterium]